MKVSSFLRAYSRSPLGILSIIVSVFLGAALAFIGFSAISAILIGLGTLVISLSVFLGLGVGQRAATGELDRETAGKNLSRVTEAEAARKRLAAMRLSDSELSKARDLLVFESGRFIEACKRIGSYDPEAVEALLSAPAIVDAWLREADEGSIEKRFSLPDANPFPEATSRTAKLLRERASLIAKKTQSLSGEIPPADCIAIEEELK